MVGNSKVRIIYLSKNRSGVKHGILVLIYTSAGRWLMGSLVYSYGLISGKQYTIFRGQKFHLYARNYKWNLERMNNSSQSTRPSALGS